VYESSSRILFINTKPGIAQFQKGVLWYKFKWKGALQTGCIIMLLEECGDDGKLRK
jgi:hypothetical protein